MRKKEELSLCLKISEHSESRSTFPITAVFVLLRKLHFFTSPLKKAKQAFVIFCHAWLLRETMFQLSFPRNQVIHLLNHTRSLMIERGERTWGRGLRAEVIIRHHVFVLLFWLERWDVLASKYAERPMTVDYHNNTFYLRQNYSIFLYSLPISKKNKW